MLKFLVFALLVFLVAAYLLLRRLPPRPPRDWGRGGDDDGPVPPTNEIGLDRKSGPDPDGAPPPEAAESGPPGRGERRD
jgi:hypothetical protein